MTIKVKHSLLAASVAVGLASPMSVLATNGMNMEGWGPIATSMGGASMAYDNGVAAVMNNVATLGLMADGESRLDVALGHLGPDINNTAGAASAASGGDSYFMPAIGYAKRSGQLTYGVGMFAQGGMGTEYDASSPFSPDGKAQRSEVGVGRLVAPIAYNLNKDVTVGGSIDYVWGGMDLQMALTGGQFIDFISTQNAGTASGSLVTAFNGAVGAGQIDGTNPVNSARFDFSNQSDISGEAKGAGVSGKIGVTYKVNNNLSVGATYHAKTSMGDLETNNATLSMNANFDDQVLLGNPPTGASFTAVDVPVTGSISVNNFQFPAQFGLGMSYKQDKWMVAADVKVIQWEDVMDSFRMTFTADATQANPLAAGFAGTSMNVEMFQNWEDQTVIQVGGAYKVTSDTTVRGGVNSSSNPVPDATLNPLFPATPTVHYTLGVGHKLSKKSGVDFSLTIVPEVADTNPNSGITTTHAQTNWQLMYTQKF